MYFSLKTLSNKTKCLLNLKTLKWFYPMEEYTILQAFYVGQIQKYEESLVLIVDMAIIFILIIITTLGRFIFLSTTIIKYKREKVEFRKSI